MMLNYRQELCSNKAHSKVEGQVNQPDDYELCLHHHDFS